MADFVDPLEEPLDIDMDPWRSRSLADEEAENEKLAREEAEEDAREGRAEQEE